MRVFRIVVAVAAAASFLYGPVVSAERGPAAAPASAARSHQPTMAQYLKPGLPLELVSARKVDRIAWIAYEEGKRNVFTAAAPSFRAVRVTPFLKDDGVDLTTLRISDDGSVVTFVRGHTANRDGWIANPTANPDGPERAIWAARVATPGVAWRLAEGSAPEVSPDGRFVVYVKDGQIYRARVTQAPAVTKADRGEKPFISVWGRNSAPKWSPDGTKLAFSTNRTTHSFVAVYDVKTHSVTYLSPSVDRDTSPTWSPDGKRIAFLRRPGLPFGQQSTPGSGTGLPEATGGRGGGGGGRGAAAPAAGRQGAPPQTAAPAPAPAATGQTAAPPNAPAAAGRQGGGGRGRGNADQQAPAGAPLASQPGLYRGLLPGGHTLALMVADVATGNAKEVWHPGPDDGPLNNINSIQWAGEHVVFTLPAQGNEESPRYHSLSLSGTTPPVRLNTTEGIVEDATAVALSKDGKTFYYCTNAGDIDRRHIWSVPTGGGTPKQLTFGDGIENVPVALASGKQIAVLSADAKRPLSVGLWPVAGNDASAGQSAQKVIYPTLGPDFPTAQHVVPTNVLLKADDGVEFHNQLFLPADLKPGEKRPALIFVHGGPARQMLLGYHYLSFYHVFYGVNQWLASQGYIVLSVNYRSGIGYGRQFRQAPNTGGRGNSEYKDVLAAGKWLAARPDVDPNRVGIWGLSYGGLLTAEALARNSDIFKAGVDLAGVHLEGSSLDPESVSYRASSISEIDNWKSPVLLIHGDDDRNVNFGQTVGLVNLLRARNVYHELIVFPDDIHETLLHSRWLYTFDRMEAFLNRFLGDTAATRGGGR
jgi:dipeptidyl aminopeptidase/acylaminoacyl peptidase